MSQQVVPGPKGNILLGSIRDFQRDPLKFLMDAVDTYGDILRFRLGPHWVYLVNSPVHSGSVGIAGKKDQEDRF